MGNIQLSYEPPTHQGFSLNFDNGYTISVMFGNMHYCEHRTFEHTPPPQDSKNAEIGVWKRDEEKNRGWVRLTKTSQVAGWVPTDLVGKIIGLVQKGQIASGTAVC